MFASSFITELASAWERSQDTFWPQAAVFVSLMLRALGLALLVGIPVGLLLTRWPRVAQPVIAALGLVQTMPSLVVLALMLPLLGLGQTPALFAAVIYSLFPIVLNTHVGITQVSPALRDAARGMGMTRGQILWHVEVPLAFPVLLAGVRTGAVYASGMIVICTFVGAGGLGDYISNGMSRADTGLIWLGAIPILLFTLILFWTLGGLERLARAHNTMGMVLGGGFIVLLSAYTLVEFAYRASQSRPTEVVVVGAKDFTEGQILAEIVKQSIEQETGLQVEIRANLGTSVIFKALKNGDIDVYPEYTGNLLTSKEALDMPVPDDKATITPLVRSELARRHGLILLETFGLNNTYAPCVTQATAERHRLRRISDLQRTPQFRVVIDQSFLTRPDGWKGLVTKYELRFEKQPIQVSPNLLYQALEHQEADVVLGFATDWQIAAQKLVVLDDDRDYFPSYHGAPLARADLLQRHPAIRTALNRLGGKIDDTTMRRLNYQVAVERRSEAEVAGEFLRMLMQEKK
jgi:osmoprotectant transport system permease protein